MSKRSYKYPHPWMPADTAPKDGPHVVVAYREWGFWQKEVMRPTEKGFINSEGDYHNGSPIEWWTYLPKDPK